MTNSVLIVSLDFELFWGMQDVTSLDFYKEHILGGRIAIDRLLSLFEKYDIHATWATVGFLFAKDKNEILQNMPGEKMLPSYMNEKLSSYRCLPQLGNDEQSEPCFYASSIIKHISEKKGMEIGSHTFSHYYCREDGQTIEQFKADLEAAKKIGEENGYYLSSLVLPRNQVLKKYMDIIGELGFTAYRDEENDWIHKKIKIKTLKRMFRLMDVYIPITGQGGYIPAKKNGVWNFPGSRMYKPLFKKLQFLERVKITRIKKQMLHAAKNGLVFHLWWHPHNIGVNTDFHMKQLEEIFAYYQALNKKYNMISMNMKEAADYFEKHGSN